MVQAACRRRRAFSSRHPQRQIAHRNKDRGVWSSCTSHTASKVSVRDEVYSQLDSAKKDAADVLEAYDSCRLKITGNSTHLAPWHTKLGYHSQIVSSLGSVTADGGPIAVMDIVVVKVPCFVLLHRLWVC
jgi:hypothetical protein